MNAFESLKNAFHKLAYTQENRGAAAAANDRFLQMVAKNPSLRWATIEDASKMFTVWADVYAAAYLDSDAKRTAAPRPTTVRSWHGSVRTSVKKSVAEPALEWGGNGLFLVAAAVGLYLAVRR